MDANCPEICKEYECKKCEEVYPDYPYYEAYYRTCVECLEPGHCGSSQYCCDNDCEDKGWNPGMCTIKTGTWGDEENIVSEWETDPDSLYSARLQRTKTIVSDYKGEYRDYDWWEAGDCKDCEVFELAKTIDEENFINKYEKCNVARSVPPSLRSLSETCETIISMRRLKDHGKCPDVCL